MSRPIVAVSGGLDPIHVGHLRMIEEAAKHGDVVVMLNSDAFLMRKKGYVFMPYGDRESIVRALKYVFAVVPVVDTDDTVCESLRGYKPDMFANGGDRGRGNIPEAAVCEELGIEMLFGIGGSDKPASSSELVKAACIELVLKGQNDDDQ